MSRLSFARNLQPLQISAYSLFKIRDVIYVRYVRTAAGMSTDKERESEVLEEAGGPG